MTAKNLHMRRRNNVTLDNHDYIMKTQFRQGLFKDKFNVGLSQYGRKTDFTNIFASNYRSSVGFRSQFDGYIGLAPYSKDLERKEQNFMYQLKSQGLIDHNIFAIDVRGEGNSTIKFGSWDEIQTT